MIVTKELQGFKICIITGCFYRINNVCERESTIAVSLATEKVFSSNKPLQFRFTFIA